MVVLFVVELDACFDIRAGRCQVELFCDVKFARYLLVGCFECDRLGGQGLVYDRISRSLTVRVMSRLHQIESRSRWW